MKIKVTKEEHAELVARCHEKANCGGCVLENVCKMYEHDAEKKPYQRLTELVEIERETTVGDLLNTSPCLPRELASTWPSDSTNVTLKG